MKMQNKRLVPREKRENNIYIKNFKARKMPERKSSGKSIKGELKAIWIFFLNCRLLIIYLLA